MTHDEYMKLELTWTHTVAIACKAFQSNMSFDETVQLMLMQYMGMPSIPQQIGERNLRTTFGWQEFDANPMSDIPYKEFM